LHAFFEKRVTASSAYRVGMRYMVIEHFRNGDAAPVYRRFREHGRLAPPGLTYVTSWVAADLTTCYQIMECDDPALLDQWIGAWEDLVDFEVILIRTGLAALFVCLVTGACGAPPPPVAPATTGVEPEPAEPRGVTDAVHAALDWLARAQREDGSWGERGDVGATGLAVLSFLHAGESPRSGQYKETVRRAWEYLDAAPAAPAASEATRSVASRDVLAQALGAGAVIQCYGMTGWPLAQAPAERAAARAGRLAPADARARLMAGLARNAGRNADLGGDPLAAPPPPSPDLDDRTSAATLVLRIMAGASRTAADDAAIARQVALVPELAGNDGDPWTQYAAATVLRFDGRQPWLDWAEITFPGLVAGQVTDGLDAGSWPPHGGAGLCDARVTTTALRCLVLENAYATNLFQKPWSR
jgi:hypothetical protein